MSFQSNWITINDVTGTRNLYSFNQNGIGSFIICIRITIIDYAESFNNARQKTRTIAFMIQINKTTNDKFFKYLLIFVFLLPQSFSLQSHVSYQLHSWALSIAKQEIPQQ